MDLRNHSPALFVFEGGECCGKTAVTEYIEQQLTAEGYDVTTAREPGGAENAERIRRTIMDCNGICTMSEALLFAAARAEFTEKTLLPALNSRKIVLLDRYYFSSLAYQGIVKNLGADVVYELNRPFVADVCIDKWFFLNVSPEEAMKRMNDRGEQNRLDRFGIENANRLTEAYCRVAQKYNGIIIDANQRVENVADDCLYHIRRSL